MISGEQNITIQSDASCFPRYVVDEKIWEQISDALAAGNYTLLGLWAEHDAVHLCAFEHATLKVAIVTLPVPNGRYPSIARKHLPALKMERAIADLSGLVAEGCPDTRPWLDHGKWPVQIPLAGTQAPSRSSEPYVFLPAEGEGMHQTPVGPIHAGIIEPGHFRFSVNGETVVRLEKRLGYAHKGIEKLFENADLSAAAKLAGRISGDSTVAYSFAFARATETALSTEIPPRAQWLRALMAELERIANHFGDIGAICNDASFALLHAHFAILREETLKLSHACFGHRLMMDCITPGGVIANITNTAQEQIQEWIRNAGKQFDRLMEVYDNTASLKNRTDTTGIVHKNLARTYGAGGFVGRASGRHFDTRKQIPYPPYDTLEFEVPVLHAGDVNARLWIRAREVKQSLSLIRQILERMPKGAIVTAMPSATSSGEREGMALVEGFRGDILVWLRIGEDRRIKRCYARDPSWFQWPLVEAAIKDNIVADFPLCNKSFNCSYSGHDL